MRSLGIIVAFLSLVLASSAFAASAAAARGAAAAARAEFAAAVGMPGDSARGALLYRTCAACHAPNGGGTDNGIVPAIAGQHARVLIEQLADFRSGERSDATMEHFGDRQRLAGPQALADVAKYVSQLPPVASGGSGDGAAVERGAGAYGRACARCHGAAAEGDAAKRVPRLAGQRQVYLSRQLHAAAERRPRMRAQHAQLFKRTGPRDLDDLAVYLASLMPIAAPR